MPTVNNPTWTVVVSFRIDYDKCDRTPGQTPPTTPEEIETVDIDVVHCTLYEDEMGGDDYVAMVHQNAENYLDACLGAEKKFEHLAGYEMKSIEVREGASLPTKGSAAVTAASDPPPIHRVRIVFESEVAWPTLSRAFQAVSPPVSIEVAVPDLNRYMAGRHVEAIDPDEAIQAVRRICRECCGVTDDAATEVRYREKEAVVLK